MLSNCGAGEDSLRVLWRARKSNQSILKEINPEYSLKGLMLKGNTLVTWWETANFWKRPWCWEDWGQEKLMTENDTVGWYYPLNGHEFEQTPGVSEEQGSQVCCSPRSHKKSDMTDWTTVWNYITCFALLQMTCFFSQTPKNLYRNTFHYYFTQFEKI